MRNHYSFLITKNTRQEYLGIPFNPCRATLTGGVDTAYAMVAYSKGLISESKASHPPTRFNPSFPNGIDRIAFLNCKTEDTSASYWSMLAFDQAIHQHSGLLLSPIESTDLKGFPKMSKNQESRPISWNKCLN